MIFEDKIKHLIQEGGPITIDNLLNRCIGEYYTHNPGLNVDFITAPEVSGLFGRTIAAWILNYLKLYSVQEWRLIEVGPGSGTLMKDIFNVISSVPSAHRQLSSVHMVDSSSTLRDAQAALLSHIDNISWHKHLSMIPNFQGTTIIIANEFFDTLPVKQYIKYGNSFREILVDCQDNNFIFRHSKKEYDFLKLAEKYKEKQIFEYSPSSIEYANLMADTLNKKGAALLIDYGYYYAPKSSTLQAMRKNQYVDVLSHLGEADLTSYVDFNTLAHSFANRNLECNISFQKDFLLHYGIQQIAGQMIKNNSSHATIKQHLNRLLIDMGQLFKVLEVSS